MSDVLNYVVRVNKNAATLMNKEASQLSQKRQRKTMHGSTATPGAADIPSVFVECFHFLKALAKDNPDVQKRYKNIISIASQCSSPYFLLAISYEWYCYYMSLYRLCGIIPA